MSDIFTAHRAFAGAVSDTLENWQAGSTGADAEIFAQAERLRNRVRALERNEPFMRRWLAAHVRSVTGGKGYGFRSLAGTRDPETGEIIPDEGARSRIEGAYADWKKAANFSVCGTVGYAAHKQVSERSVARDGGVFVRGFPGFRDNPHRFAVQLVEIDRLDMRKRWGAAPGNVVRGGIEMDAATSRPRFYHWHTEHPGNQYAYGSPISPGWERVSTQTCLHRFYHERAEQSMGSSLAACAIVGMKNYGEYASAEVSTARAQAETVGVWEKDEEYDHDPNAPDPFQDLEAGSLTMLNPPKGARLSHHQPTHPNGNFSEFQKAMAIYLATGLLQDYPTFSGDLAAVSFSGLRHGATDIDTLYQGFREVNKETEETFLFEMWMAEQLRHEERRREIGLELGGETDYFLAEYLDPPRPWVHPKEEVEAMIRELEAGTTSLSRVVRARHGTTVEDLAAERAKDREVLEEAGEDPLVWMGEGGAPGGASQDSLARTLQQIYLAVGKVITAEEARKIVNEMGGDLSEELPEGLESVPKQNTFGQEPNPPAREEAENITPIAEEA